VEAQTPDLRLLLGELVPAVQRGAVHRAAAFAGEHAVVRVEVLGTEAQQHVVDLWRHRNRMHTLPLGQAVAARVGEAAPNHDRALLQQHRPPTQPQDLRTPQPAERRHEDDRGVEPILRRASGKLGDAEPPLGLRMVGATERGPDERPHLLDGVDLEIAGVLDLGPLETVHRVDVDAEAPTRDLEDARQDRAALVERAAGQSALNELVPVVLQLVGIDVYRPPSLPARLDLADDLFVRPRRVR
jgi:hypothetical protein